MKLLHIVNEPIPGTNGGSTHILEVDEGLVNLGWDVVTVAPLVGDQKSYEEIGEHYRIYRFKIDFGYRIPFLYFFHIGKILRKEKPDIILERYISLGGGGVFYPTRIPKVLEVNAPVLENALAMKEIRKPTFWVLNFWRKYLFSKVKKIKAQNLLCVPYKKFHEKTFCLNYGVNIDKFHERKERSDTDVRVVYVGAFHKWHGVLKFLESMPPFPENVYFTFVGSGKEFFEAKKYESENVRFLGDVSYSEIPKILSEQDIAIAPFDVEQLETKVNNGFFFNPIKIYEYMACALPVVTFDNKSLRAILGGCGIFVGYNCWADYFSELLKLVNDKSFREVKGKESRERIIREHLTWEEHCNKLDIELQGVMKYA